MYAILRRRRSAVVLVERDRVALIRRTHQGHTYYVFPGGGVELGETDEEAAVREAREELGIDVEVLGQLGWVGSTELSQVYFRGVVVGGVFGSGVGPKLQSLPGSEQDSYEPVWIGLDDLSSVDVRPWDLAAMLASGSLPDRPVQFVGCLPGHLK